MRNVQLKGAVFRTQFLFVSASFHDSIHQSVQIEQLRKGEKGTQQKFTTINNLDSTEAVANQKLNRPALMVPPPFSRRVDEQRSSFAPR
ncbi:MAG: hypothetical protein ACFCBU_07675 [Cyanophyceae cyanobacterium]